VKGVILAGGTGSRLHPLTRITNKHLLPIHDRSMVSFAIEALVRAGITELMVVTGGTHAGEFLRLLGNGHEYGIDRLSYAYQERAGGEAPFVAAIALAPSKIPSNEVQTTGADWTDRTARPAGDEAAQRTGAASADGCQGSLHPQVLGSHPRGRTTSVRTQNPRSE